MDSQHTPCSDCDILTPHGQLEGMTILIHVVIFITHYTHLSFCCISRSLWGQSFSQIRFLHGDTPPPPTLTAPLTTARLLGGWPLLAPLPSPCPGPPDQDRGEHNLPTVIAVVSGLLFQCHLHKVHSPGSSLRRRGVSVAPVEGEEVRMRRQPSS